MSSDTEKEKRPDKTGNELSAMIDKLLANPEIISTVASALSKKSEGEADGGDQETKADENVSLAEDTSKGGDIAASLLPMLSKLQGAQALSSVGKGASKDKRACLLVALKPYLCRQRCEAIDQMLRLLSMTELFRSLS